MTWMFAVNFTFIAKQKAWPVLFFISLRAIQAFGLSIVQTTSLDSALCPCAEVASRVDLD